MASNLITLERRGADFSAFIREVESLKQFPRAAASALNRTADAVRSSAVKSISADIGVKQKAVRDAVRIQKARQGTLEARVVATGARIPIIDLKARETKKGITWAFRGARRLIPHSFIATMRSGHKGVFKRRGRTRLSIDELFGPSIPLVFSRKRILESLKQIASDRMLKELKSALKFFGARNG